MDFSEKWGKDVEDAVELALSDLKLTIDQVNVTVLEEPSKGFFGLGSKLALVRVEKKGKEEIVKPAKAEVKADEVEAEVRPEKLEAKPQKAEAKAGGKPGKKEAREKREVREIKEKEKPLVKLNEIQEDPSLTFLKDMTQKMGLDVDVKGYETEDGFYFEISGPDCGTIIGKRGQTLDSIQYLTSLVANKDREKYLRVIVDAENYRLKREKTLEQLANRLGDKVKKSGKSVKLEPMNPYERKVIHATLQRNSAVTTRSEGEEPYRRVVIERK